MADPSGARRWDDPPMGAEPSGGVRYGILGPLAVTAPAGPLRIGSQLQRVLLAVLLVAANRPVPADRLAYELWGDRLPRDPAGALRTQVSRLRKILPPEVLVTEESGYRLHVAAEELDANRFEHLLAAAAQRPRGALVAPARRSAGPLAGSRARRVRRPVLCPARCATARGAARCRPRAARRPPPRGRSAPRRCRGNGGVAHRATRTRARQSDTHGSPVPPGPPHRSARHVPVMAQPACRGARLGALTRLAATRGPDPPAHAHWLSSSARPGALDGRCAAPGQQLLRPRRRPSRGRRSPR